MPYSVLIVDDSYFFQARLKGIINESSELNVVGVAGNGKEAIDMAARLKPDIISMDYEMPFLDGVSAVKVIMQNNPTPIVMFSSMTYEGAKITLDALAAGAVDFMNKNFAEVSANSAAFKKKFHDKLINFAKSTNTKAAVYAPSARARAAAKPAVEKFSRSARAAPKMAQRSAVELTCVKSTALKSTKKGRVKLVAIGASTGGPVAVAEIITALPASFPAPIMVIQHMPENFTKAFADRLNRLSGLQVKEAVDGDRVEVGSVLIAPGGKQMMVDRSGRSVKIIDGDDRVNYKPCVDITFASAAAAFNSSVLAVVLTGMGSDGCDGARLLKSSGSTIWSQDQESCVVYGMPAAVANQNLSSCQLPLKEIAGKLISSV